MWSDEAKSMHAGILEASSAMWVQENELWIQRDFASSSGLTSFTDCGFEQVTSLLGASVTKWGLQCLHFPNICEKHDFPSYY